MSLARALLAVGVFATALIGCSPPATQAPASTPGGAAKAPPPKPFFAADDVRPIDVAAPIPVEHAAVVSPLPNQRRLPATIAGLEFGRPMADTASSCLVPAEPVTYDGIQGETTRCSSAPDRVGESAPEVILYALSGSVNALLFSYGSWQSAAAIIPKAYGDPTITEGDDERELEEFRGETNRRVTWKLENGAVVLFYEDGWHLLFAYRG